ncbi:hypothetical protein [Thermoplasma volcanium GSS1]|uniref:Uncharacterized protein n=1 Tax=Thermoplasma volcanium (strain ATCC 51530 / DSM 4299 / JCM 9571 / NBRC 15438 / GSS1) TaxID=273116 RepID=Q979F1_THEVO|nr:RPA family protein [Thermoplasma volcanium]BAB60352.1 hypothetical protein [Thermoplasma volcanium GSS1]
MMNKREQDYWIFSVELRESKVSEENGKSIVITPLGLSAKRILIAGTVSSKQSDDRMARISLADPIGSFYVTAFSGGFNPEEKAMVDSLEVDDKAMVMGKINPYRTSEGVYLFSIRPELVSKTGEDALRLWTLKAYYFAKRRIYAIREAQKLQDPKADELISLGYSRVEAEAAISSIKNFPGYDYQRILEAIETAIYSVSTPTQLPEVRSKILNYIKENDTDGKGCKYEDIVIAAKNMGIDQSTTDEILNTLGSSGEIFEISLKRYKAVEPE